MSFGYSVLGFGAHTSGLTLTDGLVSWWSLDETSGTRYDAHGSNDLTDVNTVGYATGKVGNAADFVYSSTEYLKIDAPIDSSLQFADEDFTLAGWVRFDRLQSTEYNPIISSRNGSPADSNTAYEISQYYNGSNHVVYFAVGDGTNRTAVESGTVLQDTWYHLICEHDSVANTVSIAINNGTPSSTAHTYGCHSTSLIPFYVGAYKHLVGNSTYHFDGPMDVWGIWRRKLTSAEKATLYASGSPSTGYPGGTTVGTYYFDTSDEGPTDASASWSSDANAFDNSLSTSAGAIAGSTGVLSGGGTTAPASGGTITQVRARVYSAITSGDDSLHWEVWTDGKAEELVDVIETGFYLSRWSAWQTLSTPTGGWTWAKVQALEIYLNRAGSTDSVTVRSAEIEVTSS